MSEHYCCNNWISIFLLCCLPGYRKYCLEILIYVSKAKGQGNSLDTWSVLLLLPLVSPAIALIEKQNKTLKKYKWPWSCLTFWVTLCNIIIFERAFIFGPWGSLQPCTAWVIGVSHLWKGVVTILLLTGMLQGKMYVAYSEHKDLCGSWRLLICEDIVVPRHSAGLKESIFVCFHGSFIARHS